MKTSELAGPALDWAVAKCEGRDMYFDSNGEGPWFRDSETYRDGFNTDYGCWEQCGPIIEREGICVDLLLSGSWLAGNRRVPDAPWIGGPTPLIAAMRCYVASRLGDDVEIPEELA